jgi:hypothetical protein
MGAGAIGTGLASIIDEAALTRWGWRVAMGFGVLIVPIGLVLRSSMPETLEAAAAVQAGPRFARYRRSAIIALVLLLSGTITTYVFNFMTTYARTTLALPSSVASMAGEVRRNRPAANASEASDASSPSLSPTRRPA